MIGSSYSAEDIGTQCFKYGAAEVTFSYRTSPMGHDWPEGLSEVPLLTAIDGNTVHFQDGSTREVGRHRALHRIPAPLSVPARRADP